MTGLLYPLTLTILAESPRTCGVAGGFFIVGHLNSRAAFHTVLGERAPHVELLVCVPESRAEPLLDNRVVERHLDHAWDGHIHLMRPGEQLPYVLGARAEHLRPQEHARSVLGVYMKEALIPEHDPAPPLVLERDPARDEAKPLLFLELVITGADDGHLGLGKYDGEGGSPPARAHIGEPVSVLSRDTALVRCFMEERDVAVGVPRDEYGALAALERVPVINRHAPLVELEARVLETEVPDVRHPPCRRERVIKCFDALFTPEVFKADFDPAVFPFHAEHIGIGIYIKLAGERLSRVLFYLGVIEGA